MVASVRVAPRNKPTRSDKAVVMTYAAVALLIGLFIIPSVLRPPQDQPQTSSAFSPDAPPDANQQSLFSSFQAAGSGTSAGVLPQTAPEAAKATPPTTVPRARVTVVARDCPFGFGNPPRQIESVYAPTCAPAFTGDNGGDTAPGVTPDTINVCFQMELTGTVTSDGAMADQHETGESAALRTYKVLRDYFNSRYQFFGRRLRFFYVTGDTSQTGEAGSRARSDKAADVHHCFAAIQETNPAESDELAKKKVLHFTLAQTPEKWFGEHDPYLWSFTPSGSNLVRLGAEYVCKKLAHKPPKFTDDPRFINTTERKFGAIVYNLPQYDNPGPQIKSMLAQCGVTLDPIVTYDLTGSQEGSAGLASAVTAMAAQNVTTIFYLGDLISARAFTQNARTNSYTPEWFIPGFGGVDTGHAARDYDQTEWKHAFGFSMYEIPKPNNETECYKAYHEIDHANNPSGGMCTYMWGNMVQLFGAMQAAGPHLTAESMKKAFLDQPNLPPDPAWHMAGGYAVGDHTYPDWASEVWWDPNAMGSDGLPGSYRYIRNGKRYTYGQWPSEDTLAFQDIPDSISLAPTR